MICYMFIIQTVLIPVIQDSLTSSEFISLEEKILMLFSIILFSA